MPGGRFMPAPSEPILASDCAASLRVASLIAAVMRSSSMVKITITGKHDCKRVQIDAGVMDDKDMLEDLITAAINDATRKLATQSEAKMGSLGAGMNLPPGMKLPF